jgi:hypothetical protein
VPTFGDKSIKILPTDFDGQSIRRVYDEDSETWWFSVIDIVQALTESTNARDYWFKMKLRVQTEEGAELSTFCRQLKLPATDGKLRLTDVATAESLLRIVQSIPSPKPSLSNSGWPRWVTSVCKKWPTLRCPSTAPLKPGSSMAAVTNGYSSA